MDFTFTEGQNQLRHAVRGYLERHSPLSSRTSASRTGDGLNRTLWGGLAGELGILGVAVPTAVGGSGGTATDMMIIMEELGANLVVEPFLETAIIAPFLLNATGGRHAMLREIVAGGAQYGIAWAEPTGRYRPLPQDTRAREDVGGWRLEGTKMVVSGAPWASRFLVTAATQQGPALFLIDAARPGITLTPYPTIDGRCAADVTFADVALDRGALLSVGERAGQLIEQALDLATVMTGARALGVLRHLLDSTIEFTGQRRQFGKPISEFQILQHRMVDMHMQIELATSAVYRAALMLDAAAQERSLASSAMKVTVGEACRFVGQNAIQLHGGMGMTDEMAVSHYFRAATAIEIEYGSTEFHLARFARLTRCGRG